MEEKKCVKFEFFTLSLKVTNLCKIIVDQNNFCLKILLTVWHQNSAFFFICLVKFTVKPHSSTITYANLLFMVEKIHQMACMGRSMHKT